LDCPAHAFHELRRVLGTLTGMTTTHPPLSREEFAQLVRRHNSKDARRLFQEIERHKALERLVREGLDLPAATPARKRQLRQKLIDAMAGQLQTPHAFGEHPVPEDTKAASRERFLASIGPMNYRDRGRVVAAAAGSA